MDAGLLVILALFLAQGALRTGFWFADFPFWPAMSTLARKVWAQRLVPFSKSPLFPPSRLRVNLETGASGTVEKVVRRRPGTVSTLPTRVMSIWPLRAATMSGSFRFCFPVGAQVDGAFEGLFEERSFGLGKADHQSRAGTVHRGRPAQTGLGCRGP